jgi:hypothetical protein
MRNLAWLLLLLPAFASAQLPRFPEDWYGDWKGRLVIWQASAPRDTLGISLRIAPSDTPEVWNWTLTYHLDTADDVRAYRLIVKDRARGHYAIDEQNSIILDTYQFGNLISSQFSVQGTMIVVNERLEGDQMLFEIFSSSLNRPFESGQEVKDFGPVLAYPVSGYHRAVLTRADQPAGKRKRSR